MRLCSKRFRDGLGKFLDEECRLDRNFLAGMRFTELNIWDRRIKVAAFAPFRDQIWGWTATNWHAWGICTIVGNRFVWKSEDPSIFEAAGWWSEVSHMRSCEFGSNVWWFGTECPCQIGLVIRFHLFAGGDSAVSSESMCRRIFVERFHTQLLKITLVRLYFVRN